MHVQAKNGLFWLVAALIASAASTANAQEGAPVTPDEEVAPATVDGAPPVEGTAASESETPPVAPPPPDAIVRLASDEVWELYEAAFVAFSNGELDESRALLERLVAEHPDHAAADSSRAILAKMAEVQDARVGEGEARGAGEDLQRNRAGEVRTTLSRAELVSLQTMHGIALGAEACAYFECDSARATIASMFLTGGAALATSLYLTDGGVYQGQAAAINSGTAWGVYHGAMFNFILRDRIDNGVGPFILSQIGGFGAGAVFYALAEPGSGQIATMNTMGVGVAALYALGGVAFGYDELEDSAYFTGLTIATDLALVGGAFLDDYYPMSRSRNLIIKASGALGALVGVGVPLLIFDDSLQDQAYAGSAMVGLIGGIGLSTYLTRDWDRGKDGEVGSLRLNMMPTGKESGQVSIGFEF